MLFFGLDLFIKFVFTSLQRLMANYTPFIKFLQLGRNITSLKGLNFISSTFFELIHFISLHHCNLNVIFWLKFIY